MAAPVPAGDPLGIPTEAILAGKRRQWCHRQAERPNHEQFRISAPGEETLMSLSRTARRISLPALLAVVLAAVVLAIAPGRATPAGASAGATAAGRDC